MNRTMRKSYKYFALVVMALVAFTSCETTELDLRVSPNDLSPDQADPNLLLNSIQVAYASNMDDISDIGAQVTRIDYMFGLDYFNNYPGNVFNQIWGRYYSSNLSDVNDPILATIAIGMLTNIQNLESIDANSDIDYSFHVGISKTMQAHMLFLLADYLGEAAFTQAANAVEFPAPVLDDGATVYAGAFALLDEAEALLSGGPSTQGALDLFYNGDTSKWMKLINTIRLRSYVLTGNTAAFNAIIASGNYIQDEAEDFQFTYGTSALQPDDRHPDYANDYTPSGANRYQSNWLMELMLDNNDPRIRYYFYRQNPTTPGADAPADAELLSCSLAIPPPHYLNGGFTYCSVENGYWGRSHGNNEGTPPDNFFRAAVGVYPTAGLFDDDRFSNVGLGLGGGGAGIEPIILSSYVDFWRGIMATSPADRATFLRSGLEKSIAKVQSFGALDGSRDTSFEPSAADVTAYIDGIVADFNAATGDAQENIFAEQYFTTLFGGGTEAYNYYRLTGFPTTVLPNWQENPGPFPRSFLYAQNEVINNRNVTQKTSLTNQVFWDTNPASPAFPPAN